MSSQRCFRRSLRIGAILLAIAAPAAAQLRIDAVPTGLQPLGLDIIGTGYAVVANSGDDSVSVFALNFDSQNMGAPKTVTPVTVVRGIPSPFAVVACPTSASLTVLVSSPSDNSVRVLRIPDGTILGTVRVGSQPYSVGCSSGSTGIKGVVSNLGDNSLTLFDVATLNIIATIPGVPGSRGLHGISAILNIAWVAGTDANVLTRVDLAAARVLVQIPVSRPTAVRQNWVASAGSNSIIEYDLNTLQVTQTYQNVPNPQDFVPSGRRSNALGPFATLGGQDAVWWLNTNTATYVTSIIPGIPGAAALAAMSFAGIASPAATVVLVTSTNSNSLFLIQQQPLLPRQFGISNASFGFGTLPRLASGTLASAFARTGVSQNLSADSLPLPTLLGGVTLRMGGSLTFDATAGWKYSPVGSREAPLLFVGPSQVNFQVPPGISLGNSVPAQLTLAGSTLLTTLDLIATSPGIFTVLMNGQGQGSVLNQDNAPNGNPQSILGAKPATRGSVIQIYATGAGETDPPLLPGEPAPLSGNPLFLTRAQPTVTMGGIEARVLFSGMAPGYVGLWQINAEVPAGITPGPAVSLTVTAGGISSNTVTIAVE